jgi:hypothetical protein
MKRPSAHPAYSAIAITTAILASAQLDTAQAQGCVAVRGGGMCTLNHALSGEGVGLQENAWLASVGYRFFKSDRHFSGDQENLTRFANNTEVINYSNFIDASVTYQITPRYSATLTLPFVQYTRSAPYEHSGVRRETSSAGMGDIRFTLGAWIWDPATNPKGNLQVSVGVKAPTGDYGADDIFYQDQDPTAGVNIQPVRRNVDQSIQPGDGGWGMSLELNAYRELYPRWIAYLQGYYLFNPQNVNSSKNPTARADAGPTIAGRNIDNGMSITDQYMARGGLTYVISKKHAVTMSLGGRMEGIPVEDLNGNAGNQEGFRRPGFSVAIEPGISWMPGKWNVALTAPWRLYANRERSYWDEVKGRHGDAAFADYLLTFSVSRVF